MKQHRADTNWRLLQSTNDLGDQHAANEIEAKAEDKANAVQSQNVLVEKPSIEFSGISTNEADSSSSTSKVKARKNVLFGGPRRRRQSQAEMLIVKPSMLSKVDLCRGLSSDRISNLASSFQVHPYRRGHIFTREGKKSSLLYILLSGKISVQKSKIEVATLEPISVFGERSVMICGEATASTIATEPVVVGSLSREVFNIAVGHDLAFELETMTRLRAVVQDAKNEQNYTMAHASKIEKKMMDGVGLIVKHLRMKVARMRVKKQKKHLRARRNWTKVRAFALGLIFHGIPCLKGLTLRHHIMLGLRCQSRIRKYALGEYIFKSTESKSDGIYILLKGKVSLIAPNSALSSKRTRSTITRTLAFLQSGDCIGDLDLLAYTETLLHTNISTQELTNGAAFMSVGEESKLINSLPPRSLSAKVVQPAIAVFISASEFFWMMNEVTRVRRGIILEESDVHEDSQSTEEGNATSSLNLPESWALDQIIKEIKRKRLYSRTKTLKSENDNKILAEVRSKREFFVYKTQENFIRFVRAAKEMLHNTQLLGNLFQKTILRLVSGHKEFSLGCEFGGALPLLRGLSVFSGIEPIVMTRICTAMKCIVLPGRNVVDMKNELVILAKGMAEINLLSTFDGEKLVSHVATSGRCFGVEQWLKNSASSRYGISDFHANVLTLLNRSPYYKKILEGQVLNNSSLSYTRQIRTSTLCHMLIIKADHIPLIPIDSLKKILLNSMQHYAQEHRKVARILDKEHPEMRGYGVGSRFGLLMPEVSSDPITKLNSQPPPQDIKKFPKPIVTKEPKPKAAVVQIRENLYKRDPDVITNTNAYEACRSVYENEDILMLGDTSDSFAFANFVSPPKQVYAQTRKKRSTTKGRKLRLSTHNLPPNHLIRLHRPCPAVSVTSLSTKSMNVQRYQPVSMQIPLPVATKPLTKSLYRNSRHMSRKWEHPYSH